MPGVLAAAAVEPGTGARHPDIEAQLDQHLRRVVYRYGGRGALALALFTAACWPTDWFVFRNMDAVRTTVGWMRLGVIVVSLGAWALTRTRLGPKHAGAILGVAGTLIVFAVGVALGNLGDAGHPWIHLGYPALSFSLLAPLHLRSRAILVGALGLALCAGFIIPYRVHWHDQLTLVMVSFVISMAAMLLAMGHLSFRILRQSFYQSMALDHLDRTREEERRRIARELHDELGQELTAMHLALALTRQRFEQDPSAIKSNLTELEALLTRTHRTTRNLVHELRPPMLDEMGLPAAVDWLARQTDRAGVTCTVAARNVEGLPADAAAVSFRIVQEALTNVVRHARASQVEVTLEARDGKLSITVADDGIGPPSGRQRRRGFGLLGIQERVMALAGHLELRVRAGGGTILAATLPLRGARSAETTTT